MRWRWRNEAKLLHQPHRVALAPVFDNFPIGNPKDVDMVPFYVFPGWWIAHEPSRVCPLDAYPVDNLISFSDLVEYGPVQVRESSELHFEEPTDSFNTRRHSRNAAMLDHAGAEQG